MSDHKDTRRQSKKDGEKLHFDGKGGRGGSEKKAAAGGGRGTGDRIQIAKRGGGGQQGGHHHHHHTVNKNDAPLPPPATFSTPHAPNIAPMKGGQSTDGEAIPYVVGSDPQLESDIRSGEVVVAEMAVIKWTNSVSFCRHPGYLPRDVVVDGGSDGRGGALPGDIVAVSLKPKSQWHALDDNTAPQDRQTVKHTPILATKGDGTKAKLNDGRTVMHGLLKTKEEKETTTAADGRKSPAPTAATHRRPATRISHECGATAPTDWSEEKQAVGDKVLRVLERRFSKFHPCRLYDDGSDFSNIQANRFYKFRPYDEHYPMLAVYGRNIPGEYHSALKEYLFMCEIVTTKVDQKIGGHHGGGHNNHHQRKAEQGVVIPAGSPNWMNNGRFPEAVVLRSLGKQGTAAAESKAIAAVCHIRDFEFPEDVEADVMNDFIIPDAEGLKAMNRRDLRNEEFICTIDPATARDLDDALSCTRVGTGFRVGVHIADVSHFVPPGTALDEEAQARSTSTYLVERVVPMLPRRLCEDYCSLNASSDKFAFSCIWEMDHDANITSEWMGQTVIKNNCKMAYEQAQAILDGDKSGEGMAIEEHNGWTKEEVLKKVIKAVENLHRVSSKLRKKRWERGAVALNRQKIKLHFADKDSHLAPAGYSLESSIDANWVVEELMLLANCRVAEKIVQWMPDAGLVRQHSAPRTKKTGPTARAAAKFGYTLGFGTSSELAQSLEKYKDSVDADVIRSMCTYCMSLAMYVSSGVDKDMSISHYALAMSCYTHFTSPIRRYADLMVHRQLLLALELEGKVQALAEERGVPVAEVKVSDIDADDLQHGGAHKSHDHLAMICEHMNDCKLHARQAGALSVKSFFCYYLEALQQQAKVDPSIPLVLTSAAVCTKVSKKAFVMYSRETTMEVEIFHNSMSQHWTEPNRVQEAEGKFIINWGKLPPGRRLPKDFKAASLEDYAKAEEKKKKGEEEKGGGGGAKAPVGLPLELLANLPGLPPGAMPMPIQMPAGPEDCVLEEAGLFFNAVVTIHVTHGAMVGIDFIVEPPWNRETRTGVPMGLAGGGATTPTPATPQAAMPKSKPVVASPAAPTAGGGGGVGGVKRGERAVFEEDDDE